MPSLTSGIYTITNKATNQPAGRALTEDKSLNPKRIVNHSRGFQGENAKWQLTVLPNGYCKLESLGAPTFVRNGFVFTALLGEKPEEGMITLCLHAGEKTYTIERASCIAGWILQTEDVDTQLRAGL